MCILTINYYPCYSCLWTFVPTISMLIDFYACTAANLDSLRDKSKTFFSLCRKSTKPELRDEQYQTLCKVHMLIYMYVTWYFSFNHCSSFCKLIFFYMVVQGLA